MSRYNCHKFQVLLHEVKLQITVAASCGNAIFSKEEYKI